MPAGVSSLSPAGSISVQPHKSHTYKIAGKLALTNPVQGTPMRYVIALVCTALLNSAAFADSTPEATLDKYLSVLTGQNLAGVATLMDSSSMKSLKKSMDESIQYQANFGEYGLQRRVFGEKVSMSRVADTPAEFYLNALASEILKAARSQHLKVTDREVIGKIQENDDMVHIVVRLKMSQDDHQGTDILVYTLVRENDEWKLKFPATIKQMLTVIESTARQRR
jgi:hypothetical protein